jgi:nicotinamidase-related amidase
MAPERLTPENTTIILVDFAVGFANVLRSHDLAQHLTNVEGLAATAIGFNSGLVVTNGLPSKPSGPLYPQLLDIIGDTPVVERLGAINAFDDPAFAAAVAATGRRKLAIAGVSTEGCVLQTVFGGLRVGYEVYLIPDTCADLTREIHDISVTRMVQAGVAPINWYGLAGEFHYNHANSTAPTYQAIQRRYQPTMAMGAASFFAGQAAASMAPPAP